jgi:hypothetical protein
MQHSDLVRSNVKAGSGRINHRLSLFQSHLSGPQNASRAIKVLAHRRTSRVRQANQAFEIAGRLLKIVHFADGSRQESLGAGQFQI